MRNLEYALYKGNQKIATVKTYKEAQEAKNKGFQIKEIFTPHIDEEAAERNRKARDKREKFLKEKQNRG